MEDITFKMNYVRSIGGVLPVTGQPKTQVTKSGGFDKLLEERIQFSAHAQKRVDMRGINLSPEALAEVQEAIDRADEKGLKDALVLRDQTAFIVNVPTKTVITVMNRDELASHVFTNINGAVII